MCFKTGWQKTVYNKTVINEYDDTSNIRKIICDTTAVNSGKLNGIVVKIQNIHKKGLEVPKHIRCHYNILDRILKNVLNEELFFVS